jgi:hypothetical protein
LGKIVRTQFSGSLTTEISAFQRTRSEGLHGSRASDLLVDRS